MTVKELIELLQEVENQDREVLMSCDPEGNGFRKLSDVDESAAVKEGYSYEVRLEELTEELREQGYTEEDVMDHDESFAALVLWP